MKGKLSIRIKLAIATVGIICIGFLIPESAKVPVQGASNKDWNPKSFWFEPWGKSGVHKGIDIFAPHGRPVISAVPGVVIYQGELGIGGNVVAVLGPKWHIHYYAHLADSSAPRFVGTGTLIGHVGTSGNAMGKPPHLHFSVVSVLPIPWRYRSGNQGWKKMFFLDPGAILTAS
jgi:peptidoglycan LD-endopeptidase LytH